MDAQDIKDFRKKFKLSQADIAELTGVGIRTVKSWEYGERNISPAAEKILESYTYSTQSGIKNTHNSEVSPVPEDDYMMVEFEDLETAAGKLGGGDIEVLPEKKKRLVPKEYAKGLFLVVRVHGHSMDDGTKRSISEGEELLIKQYFSEIKNLPIRTKLFVIVTNEGSVVKQIIDKDDDKIICHSFNPAWEDYIIKTSEITQIFTVEKKVKSNINF